MLQLNVGMEFMIPRSSSMVNDSWPPLIEDSRQEARGKRSRQTLRRRVDN